MRGSIKVFSEQARRRLQFVALNCAIAWESWVDLTYPSEFPRTGGEVKRDLGVMLRRVGRKVPDWKYLWVLEFQKRGAPHVHMLSSHWLDREWLKEAWYRVVGSGDEKHREQGARVGAIRSREGAVFYLAKYLGKNAEQKVVPEGFADVGRWWGCTQGLLSAPDLYVVEDEAAAARVFRTLRRLVEADGGRTPRHLRGGRKGNLTVFRGAVAASRVGRLEGRQVVGWDGGDRAAEGPVGPQEGDL